MPILNSRAVLLVKKETTTGVDASPSVSVDAIQVINPEFSSTITQFARTFSKHDISPYPSLPGRALGMIKFALELSPSGVANTAPRWARCFEGCSLGRSTQTGVSKTLASSPTGASRTSNVTTFTTTTNHGFVTGSNVVVAGVTDTTFNGPFTVASAPTATTYTVANTGTNSTSGSGTASLVTGEQFQPITDSPATLTLYLYLDGMLHKLVGAMGTFQMHADAGNFGQVDFNFTGVYVAPTSTTFPTTDVYDNINPPLFEYGSISFFGDTTLAIKSMTFDAGNKVVEREDANSVNGFRNVRVSTRAAVGGLDPEVELTHTFWARLRAGSLGAYSVYIGGGASGVIAGQTIQLTAPQVQITNLTYQDRDNFRAYQNALAFQRLNGNDEYTLVFA